MQQHSHPSFWRNKVNSTSRSYDEWVWVSLRFGSLAPKLWVCFNLGFDLFLCLERTSARDPYTIIVMGWWSYEIRIIFSFLIYRDPGGLKILNKRLWIRPPRNGWRKYTSWVRPERINATYLEGDAHIMCPRIPRHATCGWNTCRPIEWLDGMQECSW